MFEDKYIELEKLKRKGLIGAVLIVIEILLIFVVLPIVIELIPELADKATDSPLISIICFFAMALIVGITFKILCVPYINFEGKLEDEVKENILKNEMNNAFNSSYREEDKESFKMILDELDVFTSTRYINDYFSIKYQNVRVKYADLDISSRDSEGDTTTHFRGQVLEFNLNNNIDYTLYVTMKEKVLFGNIYMIDSYVHKKNNKVIVPTNNILKEDLVFKSNANPTIIEDTAFQEIINNLINDKEYSLIFNKDKLYVFINNYNDFFEIKVKDKQEELNSEEKIRAQINGLKEEIDKILNYKERLNIKEDSF